MRMKVQTYLNDGPGRFWGYQPGDRLYSGPALTFDMADAIGAPDGEAIALDKAWVVGNRMDTDSEGTEWPSYVRSLSAGDVMVIGETAFSVASIGFEVVDGADLARSLGPDAVEAPGGSFGPPARSRAEAGLPA